MNVPQKPTRRHGCTVLTKNAKRAHQKNCAIYEANQRKLKAEGKIVKKVRPTKSV